jgi:hypothetical protein
MICFCLPCPSNAKSGQLSFSLEALGVLPSLSLPTGANSGLGLGGMVDYRVSKFFDFGLSTGFVEFIAPTGNGDMKTVWLDLMGRFFPLPASSFGEPYLQLGFGFSPYIGGIFEDYWSYYAAQNMGQPTSPGSFYGTTDVSIGCLFPLGGDWSLDSGIQYDVFWPPTNLLLQTFSLRTGIVRSFDF